ncbi:LOB domain-containing protein 1-like [Cryptomeria japonica]|uniref:LOB domain-containing protein 1-like n=1 Tax=Cryptomeria japonica TaxID=3369 RepID=UPI0027DA6635|nr:LOB domain-containing protein 1-like [Cryptomeria japonica]
MAERFMEQKAQDMFRIVYACGACKIQRTKCGDNCVLAPYFPSDDPHKFLQVNKLFGTSRIVKILQDIPVEKREEGVKSMVYEASARVHDPTYGCTGEVHRLQKRVLRLQSQVEVTEADLQNVQADLVFLATGYYNAGEIKNNDESIVLEDDEDLFPF